MKIPDTPEDILTGTIGLVHSLHMGRVPVVKKLFPGTGLCHFFRGLDRTRRICMGW